MEDILTKSNGFHHGYAILVLENRISSNRENIRKQHNYYLKDKSKEIRGIKEHYHNKTDYKCIDIELI